MSYSISSLDNKNFEWFSKNPNCKSLKSIEVSYGKIRQIQSIEIDFKYPITAIAGKNGSGKSTLLAIIACAYHNKQNGYNPYKRKNTYYTFKDFFIETQTDTPMDDHILIRYGIYYNKWRQNKSDQNQERIGFQSRKRSYKKWNDYSTRISRNVVFISTDRIAPKYMTSIGRNHKKLLETNTGNSEAIINSVSNIMGRSFQDLKRREYSKHRITQIRHNNTTYSSFNMGAGEDSLFEIMHVLHNCPNETLILIDEIELGLHEEAQSRLLNELKNICQKKCLQIIFTTHSSCVMNALPPEGRLFIESNDQAVKIISEISTKFATGKLSGKADHELSIYTEDDICETALIRGLDNELVRRSKILPIGSALAVVRHASEMLKEDANRKFICLIDGDKKTECERLIREFVNQHENSDAQKKLTLREKIEKSLIFFDGSTWPEKHIFNTIISSPKAIGILSSILNTQDGVIVEAVEYGINASKHSEIREFSRIMGIPKDLAKYAIIDAFISARKEFFDDINERIKCII